MKKRHRLPDQKPKRSADFNVMNALVDKRSPGSSPRSLPSKEGSPSSAKFSGSAKSTPRTSIPKPSRSKYESTSSSFEDSGITVTPPKSKRHSQVLDETDESLRAYIKKMEENNEDLAIENKNIYNEMNNKIKFVQDLQTKYDECLDKIVELNSKVSYLQNNRTVTTELPTQSMVSVETLGRNVEKLKEENKTLKIHYSLLQVDNGSLKAEVADLKETIEELKKGNRVNWQPPSFQPEIERTDYVRPERRNLTFGPRLKKPERVVSVDMLDIDVLFKDDPKQRSPPMESVPNRDQPQLGIFDTKHVLPPIIPTHNSIETQNEHPIHASPPITSSISSHHRTPTYHSSPYPTSSTIHHTPPTHDVLSSHHTHPLKKRFPAHHSSSNHTSSLPVHHAPSSHHKSSIPSAINNPKPASSQLNLPYLSSPKPKPHPKPPSHQLNLPHLSCPPSKPPTHQKPPPSHLTLPHLPCPPLKPPTHKKPPPSHLNLTHLSGPPPKSKTSQKEPKPLSANFHLPSPPSQPKAHATRKYKH